MKARQIINKPLEVYRMENNNKLDVENLAHYYFEWKLPIAEIANLYSAPPYKIHHILKKSFPDIKYRKVKKGKLRQSLSKEKLETVQ